MEKKDRKLPIYTLVLKDDAEDSGVNYVALVDEPAIEQNWFAFAKEQQFKFAVMDEERKKQLRDYQREYMRRYRAAQREAMA